MHRAVKTVAVSMTRYVTLTVHDAAVKYSTKFADQLVETSNGNMAELHGDTTTMSTEDTAAAAAAPGAATTG